MATFEEGRGGDITSLLLSLFHEKLQNYKKIKHTHCFCPQIL